MSEHGILFSAPMVLALLAGTKSQTRRIVKPQPDWDAEVKQTRRSGPFIWPIGSLGQQCGAPLVQFPHGLPGDTLWVRENFRLPAQFDRNRPSNVKTNVKIHFEANGEPSPVGAPFGRLRPSIHLPRERSRIILSMDDVRVERLRDISEADAVAEGIVRRHGSFTVDGLSPIIVAPTAKEAYLGLWSILHGADSVRANPFIWAYSFSRV